jgi:hypothetical protein
MRRSLCLSFALLTAGLVAGRSPAADEPKAKPADEPKVKQTYLGAETGTVVKVGDGSITVKEQKTAQTGTTTRRSGNRTIQVPTYSTKTVEMTYQLALDVTVKTAAGKEAKLQDVKPGMTVKVYGYRVTETTPGEKPVSRVEVKRIDVPTAPADTTPPPMTPPTTTPPTTEK